MLRSTTCIIATFTCGAFGDELSRVKVPRGTGWGNNAWPDNGEHDLESSADYAYLEVDIYGETSLETSDLKKYKDAGHLVFCYFSIGTLEENRLDGQCKISGDVATCKENQDLWRELTVKRMGDWPELWLDIENPKLRDIMGRRIKMAKDAGCHGIEPDNIDCYDNSRCGKSKSAQKDFNKWTVDYAHSLGLSVCAKNVNEFMSDIDYDCAVVEQAFQQGNYEDWKSFAEEKAVFAIEYGTSYSCSKADDYGMSLIYCDGSDDGNDNCKKKTKMSHCHKDSSLPKIECTSGSYDTETKSCSGSSPTPSPSPTPPTPTPPTPKDWCTDGIYKSDKGVGVCCAKSCGQCGGTGCGSFPGGKWNCCADALATDGDDCKVPEDTGCRIPSSKWKVSTESAGIIVKFDDESYQDVFHMQYSYDQHAHQDKYFDVGSHGGRTALRIRIYDTDKTFKEGSSTFPRSELAQNDESHGVLHDVDYELTWDCQLEKYISPYMFSFMQFHYDGSEPNIFLKWESGSYNLWCETCGENGGKHRVDFDGSAEEDEGTWITWKVEFKLSKGSEGYLRVFRDGVQKAAIEGTSTSNGSDQYLKLGLYTQHIDKVYDTSMLLSNLRLTGSSNVMSAESWCSGGITTTKDGVIVCCAGSCGHCGGDGCDKFPGGKWNCCANAIVNGGGDCQSPDQTGCWIPEASLLTNSTASQLTYI